MSECPICFEENKIMKCAYDCSHNICVTCTNDEWKFHICPICRAKRISLRVQDESEPIELGGPRFSEMSISGKVCFGSVLLVLSPVIIVGVVINVVIHGSIYLCDTICASKQQEAT
jgi:hypothetical protein